MEDKCCVKSTVLTGTTVYMCADCAYVLVCNHSSGDELSRPNLVLPLQMVDIERRLKKFAAQCQVCVWVIMSWGWLFSQGGAVESPDRKLLKLAEHCSCQSE